MQFVLHSDKGFDECFQNWNRQGTNNGNCGSDGTNFIPCQVRYIYTLSNNSHCNVLSPCSDVMCGMIFCNPGDYQNVIDGINIVSVSPFIPSLQQNKECK